MKQLERKYLDLHTPVGVDIWIESYRHTNDFFTETTLWVTNYQDWYGSDEEVLDKLKDKYPYLRIVEDDGNYYLSVFQRHSFVSTAKLDNAIEKFMPVIKPVAEYLISLVKDIREIIEDTLYLTDPDDDDGLW